MTAQQLRALEFPCVAGEQTCNIRFYRIVGDWSVGLTMNVGFE